jgi:lipid kinase YegS
MGQKSRQVCLLLHKKSCTRPEVKQAIKDVRRKGVDISVRIPWSRKDQNTFIKDAIKAGVTRFVAGGGDGTLNSVVNALMKKKRARKVSLGVMPLGTANDFARGAGLPLDDLAAALYLAATGKATSIDVGQANENYFINVASGGFGAEVTAITPQNMKKALGGVAYSLVGLVRALQLEPYTGKIVLPDGTSKEGSMVIMAVGNNRFAGGAFEVAPKADLTDGLLDLAVLASADASDLKDIAAELTDPFNKNNKFLMYRQLESFVIESDRPLHMNLDGEPLVERRFEFKTHPRALSVVLGSAS